MSGVKPSAQALPFFSPCTPLWIAFLNFIRLAENDKKIKKKSFDIRVYYTTYY
jgi:hypothetical protein